MYINYIFNWLYRIMQAPVPLVASETSYGLVTVFDLFLFSVYCGVFIVLIRYLITDNLSLKVGEPTDFTYSSSAYLPSRIRQLGSKTIDSKNFSSNNSTVTKSYRRSSFRKFRFSNRSVGGRIINEKRSADLAELRRNSRSLDRKNMGDRIVLSKFKKEND